MKTKLRLLYGIVNYCVGGLLLVMPFINTIEQSLSAYLVPSFAGAFMIVTSLLTKYELGILPLISFRENLTLGVIVGLVVLLSPFVFNFYIQGFVFHIATGLLISLFSAYVHRSIFVNRHRRMINALR